MACEIGRQTQKPPRRRLLGHLCKRFACWPQATCLVEYNGTLRSAPTTATKKRGFVIACDLSEALDAYAEASGRQLRDILDMVLRRYRADVVGESGDRA
jgi:hypothetical protein